MSGDLALPLTANTSSLARADVRLALTQRDFGALFRLLHRYQGATQSQMAAATGLTQGRISKLMSDPGVRIAHIDVIERIADNLKIPGSLLGLAVRPWEIEDDYDLGESHRTENRMLRRTALQAGGAFLLGGVLEALDSEPDAMNSTLDTTNVSDDTLRLLEGAVERLGVQVIHVAPTEILNEALGHFRTIRRLLRENQKTSHRARLVRAGGRYATVIGEILFNQGNFDLATSWYRTAHNAAVDIGDRYLADITLAGQCYIPTYSDNPNTVLRITDARLGRQSTPTPAIAWLWGFKAKAHAALGQSEQARAAFENSRTNLNDSLPMLVHAGIFSFLPEKLALYEASASVTLGEPANAISAAETALQTYDSRETTEPALARFERASALVLSGETDEACRYAVSAVLDPRVYPSISIRTRAATFDQMLRHQNSPAVSQWRDVMQEVYSTPSSAITRQSLPGAPS